VVSLKVKLDVGAHKPTRAHDTDAGLDLYAYNGGYIPPHGTKTFGTGVHIELPPRTCGLLVSKSGLLTKHGISSTGLIDEGYIGEIKVTLINNSDDDYFVSSDDKISQLVIIPCRYEPVQLVDSLNGGKRGNNGFGSTGK
jgi:dUTP pyrophosphatase